MALAKRRMLSNPDKLASRVEELLNGEGLDPSEAAGTALAELATKAFEEAVDNLWHECSRHAKIEYLVDGNEFLDEACQRLSRHADGLAPVIAGALAASRDAAPGQVEARLEFGLREDGLLFGRSRQKALGGSFEALRLRVDEALEGVALAETRSRLAAEGTAPELAEALAPQMVASMLPALRSAARAALPSEDCAEAGRPLAAAVSDLADRLTRVARVEFSADAESFHTLSGPQAGTRLAQVAHEANAERPNAAALSRFLAELGI